MTEGVTIKRETKGVIFGLTDSQFVLGEVQCSHVHPDFPEKKTDSDLSSSRKQQEQILGGHSPLLSTNPIGQKIPNLFIYKLKSQRHRRGIKTEQ